MGFPSYVCTEPECSGRSFASPRGLASHRGRVHTDPKPKPTTCEHCGALVGDVSVHKQWHERMATVARGSDLARTMLMPIGPDLGSLREEE